MEGLSVTERTCVEQAMAADMQGRIRPGFFEEFSFDHLRKFSPRELESGGRVTVALHAGPDAAMRGLPVFFVVHVQLVERLAGLLRGHLLHGLRQTRIVAFNFLERFFRHGLCSRILCAGTVLTALQLAHHFFLRPVRHHAAPVDQDEFVHQ